MYIKEHNYNFLYERNMKNSFYTILFLSQNLIFTICVINRSRQ